MTRKLRGIIVDDEKDHVDSLTDYFELRGISIVGQAYNGCDAAKIYEKTNPDFVILDMKMPHYDGVHAIKEIKKISQDARIFVVTGYHPYDNLEKDTTAVFIKPIVLSKFYDKIIESL